jgi:uncharacterized protein
VFHANRSDCTPCVRLNRPLFVVEVVLEGVRYTYGFLVDDERFREEWLYSYPEKRRRVLFDRNDEHVRFGMTIPEQRGKAGVLTEPLQPNPLFLSLTDTRISNC